MLKQQHKACHDGPCGGNFADKTGMILGAKFRSWANFPWFFQK
jgi:hypothetical protein